MCDINKLSCYLSFPLILSENLQQLSQPRLSENFKLKHTSMILSRVLSSLLLGSLLCLSHHTMKKPLLCISSDMVLGSLFCLTLLEHGFGQGGHKRIPSNLHKSVILHKIVLIFLKSSVSQRYPIPQVHQSFSSHC